MVAVEADADWPLVFAGKVFRTVKARSLWQKIMRVPHDVAGPEGVIFIDRVNSRNPLAYCESHFLHQPAAGNRFPMGLPAEFAQPRRFVDQRLCG